MNHNTRRPLNGVFLDGSDTLLSDAAAPSQSTPVSFRNILVAASARIFRKRVISLSAGALLITSLHAAPVDITADSVDSKVASSVYGLKYDSAADIGKISARVQGTALESHYAYGLWGLGKITIDEIAENAVISGTAGRNYAYGIYSEGGDITVNKPIAGQITATVHTYTDNARAYGYGITTKSGNITLGGLSSSGSISVQTSSTKGMNMYGIWSQANGNINITGPIAGKIEVLGKGTGSYGIWSSKGGVNIDSFSQTGSLTVTGGFSAYGVYSKQDIVIGDINGTIDVRTEGGNFAYGIHAATLDAIDKANITIGDIGGKITVKSGGKEGHAIYAQYGKLKIGDISGEIIAESAAERASALSADSEVEIGTITKDAVISAKAAKNAYAIFPGQDEYFWGSNTSSDPWSVAFLNKLTIGDIHGTVSSHATEGESIAIVSRHDLSLGEIGKTAVISATSDGTARAAAVWASFGHVDADNINGTIIAKSASGDALGVGGFSLNVNIGPSASISAESDTGKAYALFSGAYQGGVYSAYNQPDSITIEAGAEIKGIIEIGGSGADQSDSFSLVGGSEGNMGVLDAVIQATVNTSSQQPSDSQVTSVDLSVGDDSGSSAGWIINNQSNIFDNIIIHENAIVSSDDASLSVKSGGSFQNYGKVIGSATLHIDAATGLTTGYLSQNMDTGELVVGCTGFGENVTLSIDPGATLGTTVLNNNPNEIFVLKQEDIETRTNDLFASLVGSSYNPDDYSVIYNLEGNIAFTDNLVVREGQQFIIGEGTNVVLANGILPEDSLILGGGMIDISGTGSSEVTNKHISGTSGKLIASGSQSFHIEKEGTTGHDVQAGTITIGRNGGEFILNGQYSADKISLGSAAISLEGDRASLGHSNSDITLASNGKLVNNAVIHGKLTGADNVTVSGSGIFNKSVSLGNNSSLVVGNSPGQQVYNSTLSLGSGSSLTFSLNGSAPAEIGQDNTERHSQIVISGSGSTLTLGGGNSLVLDIGEGLLNNPTAEFSLVLIKYVNGASEDASFNESNFSTSLSGLTELIDGDITYTHTGTELILNGTLNLGYLEDLIAPSAISYANALWSSAGMVHGFAKKANSYLDVVETGKNSIWVSGIGDFMSFSSSGNRRGFDSNSGGYTAGIARGWNEQWSSGIAFAQSFGTNEPDVGIASIEQDATLFLINSRYAMTFSSRDSLLFDLSFAYGSVENKIREAQTEGSWDDDVYTIALTSKWKHQLNSNQYISPFISLQYVDGAQDNFSVAYDSGSRHYSGADLRRLILPIGVTWQGVYSVGRFTVIPEVTVAYEADLTRTNPEVSTGILGRESVFRGVSPARSAVTANAGVRWIFNSQWSATATYFIDYASGRTAQAVNAGLIYTF